MSNFPDTKKQAIAVLLKAIVESRGDEQTTLKALHVVYAKGRLDATNEIIDNTTKKELLH